MSEGTPQANEQPGQPQPEPTPAASPASPGPANPSTLVQPLAALPPSEPMVRYPRRLGRLTKIEIDNYRAFRGHFEIDLPDGCNLLVYGENGAGKSSLFNALCDFLESPNRRFFDEKQNRDRGLKHDDHRHRFSSEPAAVRLSFATPSAAGDNIPVTKVYEWSAAKNDPLDAEMRSVDKAKGCLDYKSLLRVHLLPAGHRDINLFDLFIDPLLAHYKNPASSPSRTFAEEWKQITDAFLPYVWKPKDLNDWLRDFNAGFERVVKDVVAKASELLSDFDKELAVEIEFTKASYSWRPKRLTPPKIVAKPSFRRRQHGDYHRFLNEARLSALAIAIYFAGLKESPAGGIRLLVLDDILIGLDMANRMVVLGIAEKLFRDWQVIILTYHKAWFEILKSRTSDGKWLHPWRCVAVRSRAAIGTECPVVVADSGTLLAQAHQHFDAGDTKAAAVYARSAWESLLSWYCAEMGLPVRYAELRRELDTNDFLRSVEQHLATLRAGKDREWARGVVQEIKHARRFVLNPNAHFDPEIEDEISAEITLAIRAVEDFQQLLLCVRKGDFAKPEEELQLVAVGDLIHASVEHFNGGRSAAALDALSRAFGQHLDELFRSRQESVPYGFVGTTHFLFTLAGRRRLFQGLTWTRMRHSEGYLLGEVSPEQARRPDFEAAVRLFSRLRLVFLVKMRFGICD